MSEYWIHQDGDVDFADGDVGDMNHEGIVIQDVQRNIIEKCERLYDVGKNSYSGHKRSFSDDEYVDWDEFLHALAEAALEEYIHDFPQQEQKIKDKFEENESVFSNAALRKSGVTKQELDVVNGRTDARTYAMKYWGWKTYRNGNIDTWLFRKQDLDAIISGIDDISEHSGWSDKQLNRMSFTITVFSSFKHFNLTYQQMLNPRPANQQQMPQFNYLTQQAVKQVRDTEIQNMHPAYKRPGVNPFGDSVLSFKAFIEQNPTVL